MKRRQPAGISARFWQNNGFGYRGTGDGSMTCEKVGVMLKRKLQLLGAVGLILLVAMLLENML